jgi:hypothetical protein
METNKYELALPEGYEKQELPYFNEWVEALESGKYKQGEGVLCGKKGEELQYCCLGVLSKIQGRLVQNPENQDIYGDGKDVCGLSLDNPCFTAIYNIGSFPDGVFVIIPETADKVAVRARTLAACNDNRLNFKEIANIIKQIWKPIL